MAAQAWRFLSACLTLTARGGGKRGNRATSQGCSKVLLLLLRWQGGSGGGAGQVYCRPAWRRGRGHEGQSASGGNRREKPAPHPVKEICAMVLLTDAQVIPNGESFFPCDKHNNSHHKIHQFFCSACAGPEQGRAGQGYRKNHMNSQSHTFHLRSACIFWSVPCGEGQMQAHACPKIGSRGYSAFGAGCTMMCMRWLVGGEIIGCAYSLGWMGAFDQANRTTRDTTQKFAELQFWTIVDVSPPRLKLCNIFIMYSRL